jgi:hypothetical protein
MDLILNKKKLSDLNNLKYYLAFILEKLVYN